MTIRTLESRGRYGRRAEAGLSKTSRKDDTYVESYLKYHYSFEDGAVGRLGENWWAIGEGLLEGGAFVRGFGG